VLETADAAESIKAAGITHKVVLLLRKHLTKVRFTNHQVAISLSHLSRAIKIPLNNLSKQTCSLRSSPKPPQRQIGLNSNFESTPLVNFCPCHQNSFSEFC
jgi:hypothetical protein